MLTKECSICQNMYRKLNKKGQWIDMILRCKKDTVATSKNRVNDCTEFDPIVRRLRRVDHSCLYDDDSNFYPYEFLIKYGVYYCIEILNGEYKGQRKLILNNELNTLELDSGFFGCIYPRYNEEIKYIIFIDNDDKRRERMFNDNVKVIELKVKRGTWISDIKTLKTMLTIMYNRFDLIAASVGGKAWKIDREQYEKDLRDEAVAFLIETNQMTQD